MTPVEMCEESELSGQDDQISPLFHEGAQDVQLINLSILPPWVAGFRGCGGEAGLEAARFGAGLWGWLGDGGPNKSARNSP